MHPVEEYQDIITLTVNGLNECEIVTLAGRRVDVKLSYNPGEDRKLVSLEIKWAGDKMRKRKPASSRVGPQATDWAVAVGEKMLEWGICPRESGSPVPLLSSPGERERNAVIANKVEVNMLQFCSVSNFLSHTTLSIKREVYFS